MNSTLNHQKHVVVAGGTGFVGTALVAQLKQQGYRVTQLVRRPTLANDQSQWDPVWRSIDPAIVASADVVINMAGASIAGGWWTRKRKELIRRSRVDSTVTLANAIMESPRKPSVFISTSAVGYYGNRPGEILDESSVKGAGFLADVCHEWEQAADAVAAKGIRVVHPRFGVVLGGEGGMLPLIALPFRVGMGGRIGGDQHLAWIDLHDLVRILILMLVDDNFSGPVNAVAPESPTNAEFTSAMGSVLRRPTLIPIPKAVAAFAGGELARELLLPDQHVQPGVLLGSQFVFDLPTIDASLRRAFA